MKFKLRDNTDLYYEIHGNTSSGKCLVFLNGLSQSTVAWGGYLPFFEKEFMIVLVDQVFQGQSGTSAEYRSFDEHAEDIKELVTQINPGKICLIGISYGGAVAQHFGVNYPNQVQACVLMATFSHKTPHFDAIGNSWAEALMKGGYALMFDVMLPFVLSESYFEKPLIPIDYLKQMRTANNLKPENLINLMKATAARGDYRKELRKIKTPTLIIHGKNDLLIPPSVAEEIYKNIEGSRYEVLEHKGHTLNLEAIPETVQLINDFLKEVKF